MLCGVARLSKKSYPHARRPLLPTNPDSPGAPQARRGEKPGVQQRGTLGIPLECLRDSLHFQGCAKVRHRDPWAPPGEPNEFVRIPKEFVGIPLDSVKSLPRP